MAELADEIETGVVSDAIIPETPTDLGLENGAAAPEGQEPKKLSLRDQIKDSVDKVRKDETGRLHKPDGKFAAKPTPSDTAPEGKQATAETETPKAKEAQSTEPKVPGPPPGWSTESKALFNTLPDHLKKDVLKREDEVSSGFKTKTEQLNRYQEIEQVLAPVRQTYQQAGIQSDAEAIKRLFMWEGMIRQNPAQALQQLAKQYGVDLTSPNPRQEPEITPALKPVLDQFGNLTQEVSSIRSELDRRDREVAADTLTKFAQGKPHFERVKAEMGHIMLAAANAGQPLMLDDAYERAIWSNPEIRAELTKELMDKASADTAKANQERAQKARQAAISPSGRAPTAPIQANGKVSGIRGNILSAVRELNERNRA